MILYGHTTGCRTTSDFLIHDLVLYPVNSTGMLTKQHRWVFERKWEMELLRDRLDLALSQHIYWYPPQGGGEAQWWDTSKRGKGQWVNVELDHQRYAVLSVKDGVVTFTPGDENKHRYRVLEGYGTLR